MKLQNISVNDIDDIDYFETSEHTRIKSSKVLLEKGQKTYKTKVKLVLGRILEVNSNNSYAVDIREQTRDCRLSGRLKYLAHETRNPICVGDFVNVDISDPENPRIEEILTRKNLLSRFIERKKVLFAANIDQVVIVCSVREPDFKATLIDRYICIAELSNIPAIICVNKVDLIQNAEAMPSSPPNTDCDYYAKNGYKVIYTSVKENIGIDELRELLKDKETLFTGHSGTGKSSLINALQPGLNLKIGEVSDFHNKGTHTTTNSRMIAWSFGGYLIDSPGIKILGLGEEDIPLLPKCFPGFAKWADLCEYNDCTHTHETHCAIKDRIDKEIPEERYMSYVGLVNSG